MMSLLISEGRKAPQTDEERSAAYRSMVAYTGRYNVEGNKWTTKPDVAWNEGWMMDQVRYFKLDGDRLVVETALATNPNLGKVVRVTLTSQKEQLLIFALTEQDRNRRRLATLHCRLVARLRHGRMRRAMSE